MKPIPENDKIPFRNRGRGFIYIDSVVVYIYNKCNK